MANLVNGYENELLDGLTGVTALTTPTTVYLALFTADPTDTGSVTSEHPDSGAYARKSLSGLFSAATGTGGSVSNTSIINFTTATADWTEVTHIGLMESGTRDTDDMMAWIEFDTPYTCLDTKVFSIAIGDLTITVA